MGRIEARLLQAEEKKGFSGVVLVSKGEEVLLNQGYGWADPELKLKNNTRKRFMIASLSKAFAAASILQLEQRNRLRVDDKIGKYLVDYPAWAAENITIHQLLNHTSGIPDYINDFPLRFKMKQMMGWTPTQEELIAAFAERPLNFYPGESFKYSNSGYVLLAKIVEEVSGKSYQQYVQDNILKPLKMYDTGFGNFDEVGNGAVAYKGKNGRKRTISNFKEEWIFGMGGMYSTTNDLHKWLRSFSDTLILNEASREKMFSEGKHSYGYGWHVYDIFGHKQVSHGGYLPGWNSYVFYYPEDTISVVVLSNYEHSNPMEICGSVSRILYLNHIHEPPATKAEKYAGRYEALESANPRLELPFEAEIVTVNGTRDNIQVKTPRGETVQFKPNGSGDWQASDEELRLRFTEAGGSVVLQVIKNGKQYRWRKLSGDYQLAQRSR